MDINSDDPLASAQNVLDKGCSTLDSPWDNQSRDCEVEVSEESVPIEDNEEHGNEDTEEDSNNVLGTFARDDRFEKAGSFLMSMKYVCGVSQTHLITVIEETEKRIDFVFDETVRKFSGSGCLVPGSDTTAVKKHICALFQGLKTEHHQKKLLTETLKVIQPKSVTIGSKIRKTREGKRRKVVIIEKNFYYVPIIEILETLLQHPDYVVMCQNRCSPDLNILDSYLKGNLAKKNPVLQEHPDALRLVLFYDDAEFCKDLSSRASGDQKLGCLYMTVDNIDPQFRGNLDTIWLVALVKSKFVKEHGLDIVLDRLMLDIRKLEEGVWILDKKTYGTLIVVNGDNLGSHELGGFKCGFTAGRPCRTCYVKLEELRAGIQDIMLRTPEQYDQQVKEIEAARTIKERQKRSSEYGINRDCALNRLSSYHAVNGLPPDIMHDVLEGSLLRGVKHIMQHCLELKLVELDWVNCAIKDFDYGYTEASEKPSPIKADHLKEDGNLHQSATQLWTLATILPLILGELVEEEDSKWEHFITLLEIARMVFSSEIHRSELPYLSDLITAYQEGYIHFYGHLKPKDHYLGHYPHLWAQYGSLINFSCLRMEANHKILKKFVYIMGNYINIPKSAAIRYQVRQAIHWKGHLIQPTSYGPLRRMKLVEQSFSHLFGGVTEIVTSSWVKVNNLKMKLENCYLTIGYEEGNPVFAKVEAIIVWPQLLLVCKEVYTLGYDTHLGFYKIEDGCQWKVCKHTDVIVRRVYHVHKVKSSNYIVMKECVKGSF